MATLDDIAHAVGVSKSTVSKALSGAGDVSGSMRKAVLEAAVELGYTRLPRGEKAPKLAVFVTNMEFKNPDDFGYDIIVGFRKLAEPDGFQVETIVLTEELQRSVSYDEYMIRQNYRGALFLGLTLSSPWLRSFESCRTPAVLYDNQVMGNPRVTYVGADNAEGMRLAVQYLKQLGHQKIGYLSSALGSYVYQQRYLAFFHALAGEGLPHEKTLSGVSYYLSECTTEHLPRLLKAGCTAIVCSHDLLAHSAMIHLRQMGLRVPDDVSVLGFDDLPLCRFTTPPLTTIRQDRTDLGKSAYCAISSQLEGVPLSTFLLHASLVCRQSCAPAPQNGAAEK